MIETTIESIKIIVEFDNGKIKEWERGDSLALGDVLAARDFIKVLFLGDQRNRRQKEIGRKDILWN